MGDPYPLPVGKQILVTQQGVSIPSSGMGDPYCKGWGFPPLSITQKGKGLHPGRPCPPPVPVLGPWRRSQILRFTGGSSPNRSKKAQKQAVLRPKTPTCGGWVRRPGDDLKNAYTPRGSSPKCFWVDNQPAPCPIGYFVTHGKT